MLERLRAHPRTAGAPVVMLSADATTASVRRLLAAGAADYVTKPVAPERLVEIVAAHRRGRAA